MLQGNLLLGAALRAEVTKGSNVLVHCVASLEGLLVLVATLSVIVRAGYGSDGLEVFLVRFHEALFPGHLHEKAVFGF